MTGIDRSTISEMIFRLIKRGLLVRKRSMHDKRAYLGSLSELGRTALDSGSGFLSELEDQLLVPLPAAKRSEFGHMLAEVLGRVKSARC